MPCIPRKFFYNHLGLRNTAAAALGIAVGKTLGLQGACGWQ